MLKLRRTGLGFLTLSHARQLEERIQAELLAAEVPPVAHENDALLGEEPPVDTKPPDDIMPPSIPIVADFGPQDLDAAQRELNRLQSSGLPVVPRQRSRSRYEQRMIDDYTEAFADFTRAALHTIYVGNHPVRRVPTDEKRLLAENILKRWLGLPRTDLETVKNSQGDLFWVAMNVIDDFILDNVDRR